MDTIDYPFCPHFYSNVSEACLVPAYKKKTMCSPHPAFLFPSLTCLMSLHNSYHHLIYIFFLSWVLSLSSLSFHDTPSPAFSPLILAVPLSLTEICWIPQGSVPETFVTLYTFCQFQFPWFNYYIYVPIGPFFQVPGSYIHIQPPGWLHLDCPSGTSDLTWLNSSKFVLQIFCLFWVLFFF